MRELENMGIWSWKGLQGSGVKPCTEHMKKLRPRERNTWLRATQLHGLSAGEGSVQGGALEQDLQAWARESLAEKLVYRTRVCWQDWL